MRRCYQHLLLKLGNNGGVDAIKDQSLSLYWLLRNMSKHFPLSEWKIREYLTYMPTQEELRREIEQQKEFFKLQNRLYLIKKLKSDKFCLMCFLTLHLKRTEL